MCIALSAVAVESVRQCYMEQVPRSNAQGIDFVAPSWEEYQSVLKQASSLCPCAKIVLGGYDVNLHLIWLIAAKITYKNLSRRKYV